MTFHYNKKLINLKILINYHQKIFYCQNFIKWLIYSRVLSINNIIEIKEIVIIVLIKHSD